ncbi:MAG TPA: hypothetical protein DEP47_07815 [Chloroflexi bacterium]|nr:hypothetical protein [Chloroflexota bacterium]
MDNIRTVLNWALDDRDVELGARLVAALREFWYWNGFLSESVTWLDTALDSEGKLSPAIRAKTLNTSSRLAFARGDYADGEHLVRQALSLAHSIDDKEYYAWSLLILGSHLMGSYDKIKQAMAYTEEGLGLFRKQDHKLGISFGLNLLGELARLDGDYRSAGQHYEECLDLSINMGDRQREAISIGNLSYIAYHLGQFDKAIDYCKKALALEGALQMEYQCAITLAQLAGPIGAHGDPKLAACLLAASETQIEAMGASVQPADKLEVDQFKNAVREQLGETEFNKAWAEGRAMTMEQALAIAVGETVA